MGKRKQTGVAAAILGIILCLCSCAGSAEKSTVASNSSSDMSAAVSDAGAEGSQEKAEETSAEAGTGTGTKVQDTSRKLIQHLDYSIETREFDEFVKNINQLVSDMQGYIEYSEICGNDSKNYGEGQRSASYTLRIPADTSEHFKEKIQEMGTLTRQSESVEDVTLQYVDTESHIAALKTEQESLMKMLEQADSIETILAVQNQLTQVRYELESYESQKKTYDNAVAYSTIQVYVQEVEREAQVSGTYGEKLMERLSRNLYGIKTGFISLSMWFLGALPYWILLAVVFALGCFFYKKFAKRKGKDERKKKE